MESSTGGWTEGWQVYEMGFEKLERHRQKEDTRLRCSLPPQRLKVHGLWETPHLRLSALIGNRLEQLNCLLLLSANCELLEIYVLTEST